MMELTSPAEIEKVVEMIEKKIINTKNLTAESQVQFAGIIINISYIKEVIKSAHPQPDSVQNYGHQIYVANRMTPINSTIHQAAAGLTASRPRLVPFQSNGKCPPAAWWIPLLAPLSRDGSGGRGGGGSNSCLCGQEFYYIEDRINYTSFNGGDC